MARSSLSRGPVSADGPELISVNDVMPPGARLPARPDSAGPLVPGTACPSNPSRAISPP